MTEGQILTTVTLGSECPQEIKVHITFWTLKRIYIPSKNGTAKPERIIAVIKASQKKKKKEQENR